MGQTRDELDPHQLPRPMGSPVPQAGAHGEVLPQQEKLMAGSSCSSCSMRTFAQSSMSELT